MSSEFLTIKDKGLAIVDGKSVRIMGSLPEIFSNLLNNVYHDRQSKEKREHISFENNRDRNVIESIYDSLAMEDHPVVYINTQDTNSDTLIKNITKDLEISPSGVHLITALSTNKTDIEEEKEEIENIVQLENYVLERKGRVYRVLLGE